MVQHICSENVDGDQLTVVTDGLEDSAFCCKNHTKQ